MPVTALAPCREASSIRIIQKMLLAHGNLPRTVPAPLNGSVAQR